MVKNPLSIVAICKGKCRESAYVRLPVNLVPLYTKVNAHPAHHAVDDRHHGRIDLRLGLRPAPHRVLPFFPPGDGMYSTEAGDEWHRHCRAPQVCLGREKYYWALVDFPEHYLAAPPAPFEQFLNARQADAYLAA